MFYYSTFVTMVLVLCLAALPFCEGSKTNGSRNEYETPTNLCIALLLLFIAWLTVLLIIFLYCRRYLLGSRPNRNAVSLETHLGETEMEEWGSTQRTLMNLSHKEPITEKHDRSTQTEHLLIESLATPERQAKRLSPIQHRISTDH
ncbi:unnamed protein product [Porites lobata]|uniref:Uncharacterized protein n=1 Tax=Porites lobata TaxID=104759 RepID=A0ABN8NXP3_9CNID|nr:unnamed protein product [Porites lobata]